MSTATVTQTIQAPPQRNTRFLSILGTSAVVGLFIFMRVWRVADYSLDGDEIFSFLLAHYDWHNLYVSAVRDAIHPPLFYVLLKLWTKIGGESLLWLRLFPVAASTLCLFPLFQLCKDLGLSRGTRNLAIFMASVDPYAVYYSQHMRMYCLLQLFGLTSIWLFQRYLHAPSRKNLIALSTVNLLLVYSHYYGWLIVGLEFLYLLWKRRKVADFMVAGFILLALFAPWAKVAAQSLHAKGGLGENLGWISKPKFHDLSWFYVELAGLAEFTRIAFRAAVVIFLFIYLFYRRRIELGFHWLVVIALAPPFLTYLASQWLSESIWGHRHLLFTVWPFLVVLADVVWSQKWMVRSAALALILLWAGFAMAAYSPAQQKVPWDKLTLGMLDQESGNVAAVPFYSLDPYLHYAIWFHLDCLKNQNVKPLGLTFSSRADIPALRVKAEKFAITKATSMDDLHGAHYWVGYVEAAWAGKPSPQSILKQRGCKIGTPVTAHDDYQTILVFPADCLPESH
ncbi:MAG TPA: glycosyltransferase family 39 protein [Candidatus Angelobacter sp.]|nr:glycosyltransferase family 39 protein [Candidatus Angelobacter sp.]